MDLLECRVGIDTQAKAKEYFFSRPRRSARAVHYNQKDLVMMVLSMGLMMKKLDPMNKFVSQKCLVMSIP